MFLELTSTALLGIADTEIRKRKLICSEAGSLVVQTLRLVLET